MTSLGRASALLAAGTMVSRITGLLRTIVLVGVIGANKAPAADAFNIANQLPNDVYAIISAGVLTAVIVPQIVQAATHSDRGNAFISKLFTMGAVVLLITTAIAMLAAPWLVWITMGRAPAEQQALAIALSYWCLPQIFFYGLYSLVGETLNARRIFGPFTWAPVANNIVSIAGFLVVGAMFGAPLTQVAEWTPDRIAWLGVTVTGAIALQAGILVAFWPRTGLRLRADFHWRGVGLGNVGRMAGWTLLMALMGLAAGILQNNVAIDASGDGPSVAVMSYAWLVFMLPYSVIVLSIGTPYFTQLSEHAHAGDDERVRARHRPLHPHPRLLPDGSPGRCHRRRRAGLTRVHHLPRTMHPRPRWCSSPTSSPHPARRSVHRAAHVLRLWRYAHAIPVHARAMRAHRRHGHRRAGTRPGRRRSDRAPRCRHRARTVHLQHGSDPARRVAVASPPRRHRGRILGARAPAVRAAPRFPPPARDGASSSCSVELRAGPRPRS